MARPVMMLSFEAAPIAAKPVGFSRRTVSSRAPARPISHHLAPYRLIYSQEGCNPKPLIMRQLCCIAGDQANTRANNGAVLTDIRPHDEERPANVRTALTNGKRAFLAGDGRSRGGRLLTDRERAFAAPLGGMAALSLSDRTRVQAAALLSVRLEMARSDLAAGTGTVSDEDVVRLCNGLARELAGLEAMERQRANPATPSLAELLAADQRARQAQQAAA